MDIGAIFFTLAVVTLVGMYVGQPYIQRRGRRGQYHQQYATGDGTATQACCDQGFTHNYWVEETSAMPLLLRRYSPQHSKRPAG